MIRCTCILRLTLCDTHVVSNRPMIQREVQNIVVKKKYDQKKAI